jgi:hypothetical protein
MQVVKIAHIVSSRPNRMIFMVVGLIVCACLNAVRWGVAQSADPCAMEKQKLEEKLKQAEREQNLFEQVKKALALLADKPKPIKTEIGGTKEDTIKKKLIDEIALLKRQLQIVLSPSELLLIESKFFMKHGHYNYADLILEEAQMMAPDNILIRETKKELEDAMAPIGTGKSIQ